MLNSTTVSLALWDGLLPWQSLKRYVISREPVAPFRHIVVWRDIVFSSDNRSFAIISRVISYTVVSGKVMLVRMLVLMVIVTPQPGNYH